MEVGINPAGLRALLESETGPVGIEIQYRAAATVHFARRNVAIIMDRSPIPVEQDVDYEIQHDLSAIIGIRDRGSITRYLDEKAKREPDSWMLPALGEAFPT